MPKTDPSDFTIFARWFSVAFVVFVLTVLAGNYVTEQLVPKIYRATVDIQIRSTIDSKTIPQTGLSVSPVFDPTTLQTELQVIRSPDVLQSVISSLSLDQTWAKRLHQGSGERLTPADALTHMNQILSIRLIRGTHIVAITTSSEMPTEAADIANAIANQYKTIRDTQEYQTRRLNSNSLREAIRQQQRLVDKSKATVDQLLSDQSNPQPDLSNQAQHDYEQQQNLLDTLNNRLKKMEADINSTASPVRIIMPAKIPTAPISLNKIIFTALWISAGIFLGMLVATLVEVGFFILQRRQAG